ncbi:hypothetical protein [Lachnotalea glycerini]|uniref:hypothetical protein n=1 Tax=Lachnotalea glycerini TaxID=1763509 RepID=UPI0011B52D2A|nr:hypothetical protein [Lachnotalea glycerini]
MLNQIYEVAPVQQKGGRLEDAKIFKAVMKMYIDQIDDNHLKLLQNNCALLRAAVIKSRREN